MFSIRAIVSYLAVATFMTGALAAPAPSEVNSCNGSSHSLLSLTHSILISIFV
jgi:hypothetical protein